MAWPDCIGIGTISIFFLRVLTFTGELFCFQIGRLHHQWPAKGRAVVVQEPRPALFGSLICLLFFFVTQSVQELDWLSVISSYSKNTWSSSFWIWSFSFCVMDHFVAKKSVGRTKVFLCWDVWRIHETLRFSRSFKLWNLFNNLNFIAGPFKGAVDRGNSHRFCEATRGQRLQERIARR